LLAWPPPGGLDMAGYFKAVAGAAQDRPVLAYHFPRVYPPGIEVEALAGLPVAGQKDSSGQADRLLDDLAHYPGATYVGSSALLALAGPLGATGALLALANVEPERCVAAFEGDAVARRGPAGRHRACAGGGVPALRQTLAEDGGRRFPVGVGGDPPRPPQRGGPAGRRPPALPGRGGGRRLVACSPLAYTSDGI